MPPDINPSTVGGLSDQEAAARLRAEGANELPSTKPPSLLATAWQVIREPMLLLLVGAGAIYLVLGELKDSVVLLVSIIAVLEISLYQQRQTERALEALRDLFSPLASLGTPSIRSGPRFTTLGGEGFSNGTMGIFAPALTEAIESPPNAILEPAFA